MCIEKMKKILISAFMLVISLMANAQGMYEISLKYAPLRSTSELYGEKESGTDSGVEIEFNNYFSIKNGSPIYLNLGLGLQYAWDSGEGQLLGLTGKVKESILVGRVPVGLVYHHDLSEKYAIELSLGLDASYYLLCEDKLNGHSYDVADSDGFNRFNFGWHGGIDAVFFKTLVVGLGYQNDFTKYYENGVESKASMFSLKLGYRF